MLPRELCGISNFLSSPPSFPSVLGIKRAHIKKQQASKSDSQEVEEEPTDSVGQDSCEPPIKKLPLPTGPNKKQFKSQ